jgi:hypothetical protein
VREFRGLEMGSSKARSLNVDFRNRFRVRETCVTSLCVIISINLVSSVEKACVEE